MHSLLVSRYCFSNFTTCWNRNILCFIDSGFGVSSAAAVFKCRRNFQFVFNHKGPPSSFKTEFNLLYNFQDHSLMIDTNIFLFKQMLFMLSFAFCFGYGLCLSSAPNVKTGSIDVIPRLTRRD